MKNQEYVVTSGDTTYTVVQTGATTYAVNGKEYVVDFNIKNSHFSILVDNAIYCGDFAVDEVTDQEIKSDEVFRLSLNGNEHLLTIDDQRSLLRKSLTHEKVSSPYEIDICSPMPGLVIALDVKVGDSVLKGSPLVVLEAMKMENELRAPQQGKIAAIFVVKGQTVEKGQKLLTLRQQ